jgi:hypothetical protein
MRNLSRWSGALALCLALGALAIAEGGIIAFVGGPPWP